MEANKTNHIPFRDMETLHILNIGEDIIHVQGSVQLYQQMPVNLEFFTMTIVKGGTADVTIDTQTYHLEHGAHLLLRPAQSVLFQLISDDFQSETLVLSENFVNSLSLSNRFQLFRTVYQKPVLHLQQDDYEGALVCHHAIRRTLLDATNACRMDMLRHVITAYFYAFGFYLQSTHPQSYDSRSEALTARFFELLNQHIETEHSVAQYAERLHLTPKYLSACVKQVTGHGAMECISEQLIRQAQMLLQNTDLTVAQVSDRLCFDSPSSFVKYFRTHVGASPKAWRSQNTISIS